jgi:hypothetical protein
VRWREAGRERSKTVDRKREAAQLDAEIKRLQRLGVLRTLEIGTIPLSDFAHAWWDAHASHLAPMTQRQYAEVLDLHVIRRLGGYQLRTLTPAVVDDFRVALERDHVGAPTVLKALTVLSSICRHAVVRGELVTNPVREVPKPRQRRAGRHVRPADTDHHRAASSSFVASRRHLGVSDRLRRPASVRGTRAPLAERPRPHALDRRGVVLGEERDETKTDRARTVRLLDPLARDLAEWRLAAGRPEERTLLFSRSDGDPWRDHDYRNWRKRIFLPAALAAGVERPRPPTTSVTRSSRSLSTRASRSSRSPAKPVIHRPFV